LSHANHSGATTEDAGPKSLFIDYIIADELHDNLRVMVCRNNISSNERACARTHRIRIFVESLFNLVRFPADPVKDFIILRQHPWVHITEASHAEFFYLKTKEVPYHQIHGAPDNFIGCVSDKPLSVIDIKLFRDGATDQKVGDETVCTAINPRLKRHSFYHCDQYRHVLRPATGHHAIDGNIPWGSSYP
jgi:hypothetical protein